MMTDGRFDWQATRLGGWLTEGLTDWLTDWLTDCLTSVLTGLQADWQTVWQARELFTPISLSLHSRFSTWRFDSIAYMKFKDGQLSWNSRLLFFTTGILNCKNFRNQRVHLYEITTKRLMFSATHHATNTFRYPTCWWFALGVGVRGYWERRQVSCLSEKLSVLTTISYANLTYRFRVLEFWPYELYSWGAFVFLFAL